MTSTSTKTQGVWAWILQRFTAVLLLFFLGTHIFVLHYIPENLTIDFLGVAARFKSVMYIFIDSGLLAASLYHGFNGVRNILFDFFVDDGKRKFINIILLIAGIVFFLWGAYALTFFVK